MKSAECTSSLSLFPDIERGAEGKFTPSFSRRFSRYLAEIKLKKVGLSFHSLRHTFRDEARVCSISDDRVCALGGWTFGSGVHTTYGAGLPMDEKLKAIEKLRYNRLDFQKITLIDWS